jgi:hypothetical protein
MQKKTEMAQRLHTLINKQQNNKDDIIIKRLQGKTK